MAEFIPTLNYTEFKKILNDVEKLKQLKSCEVNYNGEYLFTFVNGHTEESGYLRTQTEYACQTANAVGGKTLEELNADIPVPVS